MKPDKRVEEIVEQVLDRGNCPTSCDGHGTYSERDRDGDPMPAQCQWCYEHVIPQREKFIALITNHHQTIMNELVEEIDKLFDISEEREDRIERQDVLNIIREKLNN